MSGVVAHGTAEQVVELQADVLRLKDELRALNVVLRVLWRGRDLSEKETALLERVLDVESPEAPNTPASGS